jgi:hypothetical protein
MNPNTPAQPERRAFGTTSIEVADDAFFNGFQVGNLLWRVTSRAAPLTDTAIAAFLREHLDTGTILDGYSAGAISGWFAAVYGYQLPAPVLCVQCYPERRQ